MSYLDTYFQPSSEWRWGQMVGRPIVRDPSHSFQIAKVLHLAFPSWISDRPKVVSARNLKPTLSCLICSPRASPSKSFTPETYVA